MKPKRHCKIIQLLLTALLINLYSMTGNAADEACTNSAQQYWAKFRGAVLESNVEAVANLTRFPFMVSSGMLDDERKNKSISRQEFIALYPQLLISDPGIKLTPTTMWDLINENKQLTPAFCTSGGGQFRVGDWVFRLKDNKWKFQQVYYVND